MDPEEAAVPGSLSMASTLNSKGLGVRDCVHPSRAMFWPIEVPQASSRDSLFSGTCHIWLHDYK
jgi:hypothetical protein